MSTPDPYEQSPQFAHMLLSALVQLALLGILALSLAACSGSAVEVEKAPPIDPSGSYSLVMASKR